MPKILAIESSCDETGAAVIQTQKNRFTLLSNTLASQIKIHARTSGVVPEVAARAHLKKIRPIVQNALENARTSLRDIDYIAVTTGPGLITSLLVGAEFAKGLALATGKKIIPVNHVRGHLYSPLIAQPNLKFPNINLIVSGGHTYLVLMESKNKFRVLGATVDDAAGEAFDKVAKMLGLPYPGGPSVSHAAKKGKKDFQFPRPMLNSGDFNFSFAGLKTAVLYKIRDAKLNTKSAQVQADICFSFENAAVEVLAAKTLRAVKKYRAKSLALSGGVAANEKLRKVLAALAKKENIEFAVPDLKLCTDNAVMIANAAAVMLGNGYRPKDFSEIKVDPGMDL